MRKFPPNVFFRVLLSKRLPQCSLPNANFKIQPQYNKCWTFVPLLCIQNIQYFITLPFSISNSLLYLWPHFIRKTGGHCLGNFGGVKFLIIFSVISLLFCHSTRRFLSFCPLFFSFLCCPCWSSRGFFERIILALSSFPSRCSFKMWVISLHVLFAIYSNTHICSYLFNISPEFAFRITAFEIPSCSTRFMEILVPQWIRAVCARHMDILA